MYQESETKTKAGENGLELCRALAAFPHSEASGPRCVEYTTSPPSPWCPLQQQRSTIMAAPYHIHYNRDYRCNWTYYLQQVGYNRYGRPRYMCPFCKRVITG